MKLVECVPNFSEGRKPEVIKRIAEAIEGVAGAVVLDQHIDPDHNRSVITFVAEKSVAVEAAVRAVSRATELIDLREHAGEHPRVGTTDVLPFVPIRGVTMDECIRLAHEAGACIANELRVPVFFYERAALKPERKNLEDIRRGGLRALQERVETDEAWKPDVGPAQLHESAGACIVGARPFLIAYNINLRTNDIGIARRIAKAVRGRDGGLRYLKALGFELSTRGMVQVSMNLVDFEKTSLHHAFEAVRREAARYGVTIDGSEVVGLIPQAALDKTAEYFLQIENFSSSIVLENRIAQTLVQRRVELEESKSFLNDLASARPAPGGGAAAAHVAAVSAALGQMVARLTIGRKKFADVEKQMRESLALLDQLRERLTEAIDDDTDSFNRVLEARKISDANMDEKRLRAARIEQALKGAIIAPLETAGIALQVLETLETLAELGNQNALSDVATGAQLSLSAIASARYNVMVNAAELEDDDFASKQRARADDLLKRAREINTRVEIMLLESLS